VIRLVARREFTERVRERSFLISTGLTLVIIVVVVALPALFGFGDPDEYRISADPGSRAIAERAAALDERFDAVVFITDDAPDVTLADGAIRSQEEPDDKLVDLLQVANQQLDADAPAPLRVETVEPIDPDADAKAGLAFFAVLLLYGQLLTYGYWVAAGVVEEKASRVVEVILSTIRPRNLLAGKVIGIGLLGLGNLLLTVGIGLVAAQLTGAIEVDGTILGAAALALAWFVVGYAFYACAFACAGALVPRQEELQSTMTPLTLIILVGFFVSFAVLDNPDGTLAHVTAFIPMTAPMTMPPRIVTGDAPAWEIAASLAVTIGASIALIPLAARIYEGGILRTGSSLKLREAWRAGRA
jgi:ABC-2 type transport system permease protein